MKRDFDVVLCGYYGFENLGDELLLSSMILMLKENGISDDRIAILSGNPGETFNRYGIYSVDRWSVTRVQKLLARSRSLLLGGGGLFQDSTSIRSCLYYWGVIALARCVGCSPWVFGNSIGPFRSWLGRSLARSALRMCKLVSVRDSHSVELAKSFNIKAQISPDPVMVLPMPRGGGGDTVFVNLRPWNGSLEKRVALSLGRYLRQKGLKSIGVAMAKEDLELLRHFKDAGILPLEDLILLKRENLDVWGKSRWSIGMRLHFNVLASIAGSPSIAIPYDPKVEGFAALSGVPLWDGSDSIPQPLCARADFTGKCSERVLSVFSRCIGEVIGV